MTVFLHELKRGKIMLLIWSLVIAFMLGVCILIYPQMSSQMGEISDMFADMGAFSDAFGMDQLNFGEFMGYFSIECGNVLGMGGAFFAAIVGACALSKEEKERTAEFLLTHPISRVRIIGEKLASVFGQILILNLASAFVSVLCILAVSADADAGKVALLFLAYFLMQLEIACITFGISAFVKGNGIGIGLGIAVVSYFMNIISNLDDSIEFLKYITPFGYTDGADIVANGAISVRYLPFAVVFSATGIILAFWHYRKKDIV